MATKKQKFKCEKCGDPCYLEFILDNKYRKIDPDRLRCVVIGLPEESNWQEITDED